MGRFVNPNSIKREVIGHAFLYSNGIENRVMIPAYLLALIIANWQRPQGTHIVRTTEHILKFPQS